jgi:AcrR family transcriptional regulator
MREMQRSMIRSRPGAGRPTREQAERRHMELLDRALELFLERGFEVATIDAIAADVGMTKRTVYGLYADKKSLFNATVQRAIERLCALVGDEHAHELIAAHPRAILRGEVDT